MSIRIVVALAISSCIQAILTIRYAWRPMIIILKLQLITLAINIVRLYFA